MHRNKLLGGFLKPVVVCRSLPVCAKAAQIRLYTGSTIFYTTRVFPTEEVGTDLGWRYFYPVHEVTYFLVWGNHKRTVS